MPQRPEEFARLPKLLGAKVRARREALGMSQEELALRVRMDRKSVQNIEYGRASTPNLDGTYGPGNPKLDTIFLLASALDLGIAYLVDPEQVVDPEAAEP